MLIASLVLCFFLIACFAAGWYFSDQVIAVQSFTVEETYQCEVNCGKLVPTDWEALIRQEVRVASPFGYELYGIFIPLEAARGTVIITTASLSVYTVRSNTLTCSASAAGMCYSTITAPMVTPVVILKPTVFMKKMT